MRVHHKPPDRLGHADTHQPLKTSSPPSLKRNLRVVRCNSRVARAFSRREMLRLTADGEAPSWRAAAEKLPVSTTLTKIAISPSSGKGRLMLMTHKSIEISADYHPLAHYLYCCVEP